MFKRYISLKICAIFLIGVFLSCTTAPHSDKPIDYKKKINQLVHKILKNQSDADALRELGVILVKIHQYDRAKILMERAYKLNPRDTKTLFYYGLSLESAQMEREALDIYRKYGNISRRSPYRRIMEGRYAWLNRKIVRKEIQALLYQEEQLSTAAASPNSIAVLPFTYQGNNTDYAPLGKGLSEMMITDLSQAKGLQLIERIRMQALVDEMALGQTGLVDTKTAPRFGKLLTAGQIVLGSYDVVGEDRFQLDVELLDILNRQSPPLRANRTDDLKNLLNLEKRIVFSIIIKMGIELTPLERDRILRIPTRNMQAFMAYCRGLESEDAGEFEKAAGFYKSAIKIDPKFDQARQKANESETLIEAGSSTENILTSVDIIERQTIPEYTFGDLLSNRLRNISDSIGSNFVPGQDNREATEEATTAGADVGSANLPDPPRPPVRR